MDIGDRYTVAVCNSVTSVLQFAPVTILADCYLYLSRLWCTPLLQQMVLHLVCFIWLSPVLCIHSIVNLLC